MENNNWPECSYCGCDTEPLQSLNKDDMVCQNCYDTEMFKRLEFITPEVQYLGKNENGEHMISFTIVARDREIRDSEQRGIVFTIRESQLYRRFDTEKHQVPVCKKNFVD